MKDLILSESRKCISIGMYFPFQWKAVPIYTQEEIREMSLELTPEPHWQEKIDKEVNDQVDKYFESKIDESNGHKL